MTATAAEHERVTSLLTEHELFRRWSRDELVAIAPSVRRLSLAEGEVLLEARAPILAVYFVVDGCLRLGDHRVGAHDPPLGLEALLRPTVLDAPVVAASDCTVYAIPTGAFPPLQTVHGEPSGFLLSLAGRHRDPDLGEPAASPPAHVAPGPSAVSTRKVLIGWISTIATPVAVALLARSHGLPTSQSDYLIVFSTCLVLLFFELVPHYATVLGAVLACLLLDIVPVEIGLSGFASGGFLMALSVFGLGSVLFRSGLATRVVLFILERCTATRGLLNAAVLVTGILMTTCVPSPSTRLVLLTPLVEHASREMGYRDGSPEATQLMSSMFVGCSIFSPLFLTGQTLNVILYAMLPQQISNQYQWGAWLWASATWGVFTLVAYIAITAYWFRESTAPVVPRDRLREQIDIKGALDRSEWIALAGTVLFVLAVTTYSFHKLNLFWIGFGLFCLFLVIGALEDEHIIRDIEWDVMLTIGLFISLELIFVYTGISELIKGPVSELTAGLDRRTFIALIAVLVFAVRAVLSTTSTGFLVAAVCLPLAEHYSIDPWLMCFAILVLADIWLWPKQASYVGALVGSGGSRPIVDPALFGRINWLTIAIRVVGLLILLQLLEGT